MTDVETFIAMVIDMRTAQKQYFKTRDTAWLNKSKSMERNVDKWILDTYTQGRIELL